MKRTFIEVPNFTKKWKELGFSDEELRLLQNRIMSDPEIGKIMVGIGGVRKMRFELPGQGKSGSVRVCFIDFQIYEKVYLLTVYTKKKKENLTDEECNQLKKLVSLLKREAGKNYE